MKTKDFFKVMFTRIRPGEVFAYFIKEKNKYGLIQVLGKSRSYGHVTGYNIRVFYNLIDSLDKKTINSTVNSKEFYYIQSFFKPDLLCNSDDRLERFDIPDFVIIPKYTRACERKPNGKLYWFVLEEMKCIKTYPKYEEELSSLSPSSAWGIQIIKLCWIEGFTLENWNQLEDKWYDEWLNAM